MSNQEKEGSGSPTPTLLAQILALQAAIHAIVITTPKNAVLASQFELEVEKIRGLIINNPSPLTDEMSGDFEKATQPLRELFERFHKG